MFSSLPAACCVIFEKMSSSLPVACYLIPHVAKVQIVDHRYSLKQAFLKISQYLQENTCVGAGF